MAWDSATISLMIPSFIVAFVIVILTMFIKSKSRKKSLNLPPGRFGLPFLGESIEFLTEIKNGTPEKFFKDRIEKYNSQVFCTSIMGQSLAVLYGPSGNRFLFSNENKLVTVWWPKSVQKILGKCIATTNGIEGVRMRKMVHYFFSPDAFTRLYIRTMDLVALQHIESHWRDKEEVKVFPTIRLYTFELACRLFMNIEEPSQIEKLASLFNIFIKGVISMPIDFPGTRFFKAKRVTDAIRKELGIIIRERRVALEQETAKSSQDDLMSHLLQCPNENGEFMSESVIINNILLLLFAGHDTSSSALTVVMKRLGEYPEVYEQVLREQNEIASSKEAGEYLQWEDIQKMKYTWNVVCEAMRFTPPLLGAFREALTDIKYEGYDIPKGMTLYWNATWTHKDPSFFQDAMKFDPTRFQGTGPTPYTYVPFGGGPRVCLGKEFARLEILIFLHNVVRKFKWDLKIPAGDEKIVYDPVPTPVEGLPIRLHPHT